MSFLNLFFPRSIHYKDTKYNKDISLKLYFPQPTLFVGGLIQSGDILTHIWKTGIKRLLPKKFVPQKILVLGLGGGSNTRLCHKLFPRAQITAVDIDPLMVEISQKYFGLKKIKNLNFIISDALRFAANLKKDDLYDLVLLDCFEGKYIPHKLEDLDFINSLWQHSRFVLINRIYWYDHHDATMNFFKLLSTRFFYTTASTRSNVIISLI